MIALLATILLLAFEVAEIVFATVLALVFIWIGACYLVQWWLGTKRSAEWRRLKAETEDLRAELERDEWDGAVRVVQHAGHKRVGVRR